MHMFRILTLIAIQVSKWGQTKHSPVQNISTNHNWGMGVDFSFALLAIFLLILEILKVNLCSVVFSPPHIGEISIKSCVLDANQAAAFSRRSDSQIPMRLGGCTHLGNRVK